MEQQTTKVLVVDDNPEIRDIIHVLLEGEGIRVTEAADGSSALHFLEKGSFDLIILDIMMPGLNGYETCQKIRQLTNVPILFLSARTSDSDKLMGFSSGGDDYLAKPFSYTELLGRTRALIRRYRIYQGKSPTARQSASNLLTCGDLCLDPRSEKVTLKGQPVTLTSTEYQILSYCFPTADRFSLHSGSMKQSGRNLTITVPATRLPSISEICVRRSNRIHRIRFT